MFSPMFSTKWFIYLVLCLGYYSLKVSFCIRCEVSQSPPATVSFSSPPIDSSVNLAPFVEKISPSPLNWIGFFAYLLLN